MTLERFDDWLARLEAQLALQQQKSFEWGAFDCALHACDCVLAITGVDLAADFRGKYSSQEEALAIMRQLVGSEWPGVTGSALEMLAANIAAQFEIPQAIFPTFARRGDVVLVRQPNDLPAMGTLGVVGLDGLFALCASDQGLARVHMAHWIRGWLIG